jgi:hypothetical protein
MKKNKGLYLLLVLMVSVSCCVAQPATLKQMRSYLSKETIEQLDKKKEAGPKITEKTSSKLQDEKTLQQLRLMAKKYPPSTARMASNNDNLNIEHKKQLIHNNDMAIRKKIIVMNAKKQNRQTNF